jgi:hypothetical protein
MLWCRTRERDPEPDVGPAQAPGPQNAVDWMEFLLDKMKATDGTAQFLASMSQ